MTKLEARMCAAKNFCHSSFEIPSSFVIRASSFPSFIQKREHQFGFGNDSVVDYAVALRFRHAIATRSRQLGVNENRIARKNRFAKFHLVRTHEIANTTRRVGQFEQKNTGHLRHRFDLHYSRHDWMTGEMPLKKRLVNRDGFYGRNFVFAFEADDPVNHQKRVAVRKDLHHFASVQTGIAYWDRARCAHRASPRLLASERASQFRIRSMSGLHRHHVTADTPTDQREIADNIEDFVPDEFV